MSDSEIREIKDRIEIEELMYRYAEMVDQRDWKKMDQIFALEATIDYSTAGGLEAPFRESLAWLDRALESWPLNLHIITNLIIEFDGDEARSRCYFHASMGREVPDGPQYLITNAGYFHDRLIRTGTGWRIVERVCHQKLMQGELPEGYQIPE